MDTPHQIEGIYWVIPLPNTLASGEEALTFYFVYFGIILFPVYIPAEV
jgi:hypothetical protein